MKKAKDSSQKNNSKISNKINDLKKAQSDNDSQKNYVVYVRWGTAYE